MVLMFIEFSDEMSVRELKPLFILHICIWMLILSVETGIDKSCILVEEKLVYRHNPRLQSSLIAAGELDLGMLCTDNRL